MSVTVNGTEGITLDNGSADGAQVTLASSGYSNWNLDNYSGRFRAYYNATEYFTIDSSGNVGIGTSSPIGRFIIQSDANSSQQAYIRNINAGSSAYSILNVGNDSSATSFRMLVGSSTATAFGGANSANLVNSLNSPMTFWTNNAERMRIDSSGYILNGVTTAYGTANYQILFDNSTKNGMAFKCSSTSYNLAAISFLNQSGTQVGYIYPQASTTTYSTSSDYRLKENIQPMVGALNIVAQLKPVTYKWKADGSDGQGFIAHELQAVVPDCVTGEKDAVDVDGNPVYQGIDTSFLVATLTAAIQELKSELDVLKAKIEVK